MKPINPDENCETLDDLITQEEKSTAHPLNKLTQSHLASTVQQVQLVTYSNVLDIVTEVVHDNQSHLTLKPILQTQKRTQNRSIWFCRNQYYIYYINSRGEEKFNSFPGPRPSEQMQLDERKQSLTRKQKKTLFRIRNDNFSFLFDVSPKEMLIHNTNITNIDH